MNLKKCILYLLVLPLLTAMLIACENRSELAKKQITPAKIKQSLINQKIIGSDQEEFQIELPGYVELIELAQNEDTARAEISIKALQPSSKTGVEGTLKLTYTFDAGQWQFRDIEVVSLEKMNQSYATRLTELIDFPLHFAANIGDIDQVKQALQDKVPINSPEERKQTTAVMFAAERGRLDIVELLVANGADINYANRNGLTALHAASYGNHLDVVKFLLEKGADINAIERKGKTPLYYAAITDAADTAQFLIANNADVNARGERGWPPIFAAAENNSVNVAKQLIEQGAEINIKTETEHYSPLLSASYYNSVEMVELLLDVGADTTAQLSSFHRGPPTFTALELAEKRGFKKVIELLSEKNAQ
jgi:ankyrin repeat protein